MKVAISGASGMVGQALSRSLAAGGHEVLRLVRRGKVGAGEIAWDPSRGSVDAAALEGLDGLVNLNGENIGAGKWTPERKQRLVDSRISSTRLLAETVAGLTRPPRAFVSASAIGYYGDRGDEILDESSAPGKDFLATLCKDWEAALAPARRREGVRVVPVRIGIVLDKHEGALSKLLTPFKLGAGGKVGSGQQWWSWILLSDLVRIVELALSNESLTGPVNAVAPGAVTNAEFAKALGRVMHRPALFPLPAPAVKLMFGEMGEALLLAGQRVRPRVLEGLGFRFDAPRIEDALRLALTA